MIDINVRRAIQLIVGLCTGYTVSQIVKNNTNPETKLQKAEIFVGGTMLGLMAHEKAERYILAKLDYIEVNRIATANDLS